MIQTAKRYEINCKISRDRYKPEEPQIAQRLRLCDNNKPADLKKKLFHYQFAKTQRITETEGNIENVAEVKRQSKEQDSMRQKIKTGAAFAILKSK